MTLFKMNILCDWTVVGLCIIVLFSLPGTRQTPVTNVSRGKTVTVTPSKPCENYCKDQTNGCSSTNCNFTCPSGMTSIPNGISNSASTPATCASDNEVLSDERLSPKTLDAIHAFNNESSGNCEVKYHILSINSFTVLFAVRAVDLRCSTPVCFPRVLRAQKSDGSEIWSVKMNSTHLWVQHRQVTLKFTDDYSEWISVTIMVSPFMLTVITRGVLKIPMASDFRLSPDSTELGTLDVILEVENTLTDGIFAFANVEIYPSILSGRDILKSLKPSPGEIKIPRIASDCRCPQSHLRVDESRCYDLQVQGSNYIDRLNTEAHYIEYANDNDEDTVWVSARSVSSSVITIDLRTPTVTKLQVVNMTVKFGSSVPNSVLIKRLFGSDDETGSECSVSDTDRECVLVWDLSKAPNSRAAYEMTLAENISIELQGHRKPSTWNFHSVAEILIYGRAACYDNPNDASDSKCNCVSTSNTEGPHCETCKDDFFHNGALTCSPCNCNQDGSESAACNKTTGECPCKETVEGEKCDRCIALHYELTSTGCKSCGCKTTGAQSCTDSGQCYCKENVEGDKCDACKSNHYWTPNKPGCTPCNCSLVGSQSAKCDVNNGQCSCKATFKDRDCASCRTGYWGVSCEENCPECNVMGSSETLQDTCNMSTGNCYCIGGITENNNCNPIIKDIAPLFGPKAGGTLVTISGQLLGEGSGFSVSINGVLQTNISRNHTTLVFKTLSSTVSNNLTVELDLGQGSQKRSETFEYRENPTVSSVTPTKTIVSGGVTLTVSGSHLNSVSKPVLRVYDSNLTQPLATQTCHSAASNGQTLECPTPDLTHASAPISVYQLGLEFDGFTDYQNLGPDMTTLTAYPDPVINTWASKRDFTYPFNLVIKMTGENLTLAVDQKDYSVRIGGDYCLVSQVSNTEIICTPPATPTSAMGNSSDVYNVTVEVGFLKVLVGQINYIIFYKSKEFIGIVAGIGGLFVIIVILVIVRKCRQSGRATKPRPISQQIQPKIGLNAHEPPARRDMPPLPAPPPDFPRGGLFNRLNPDTNAMIKAALIDMKYVKPGNVCTKKGEIARIIDGKFTQAYHKSPGSKLTIKTFVNSISENEAIPPWANTALIDAVSFYNFLHPNILELFGICFDNTKAYVLYPNMSNRSLKDYIVNPQIDLGSSDLVEFGLQIAEGMEFLELKGLVHKDLAARNCMVDDELTIKICDISFSKDLYSCEYVYDAERDIYNPLRWMAPEQITRGYHDIKSDVWSYGVVLWEICTRGALPYGDIADDNIPSVLEGGGYLGKADFFPDDLDELMTICWKRNSEQRPCFSHIVDRLRDITECPTYENHTDYLNTDSQAAAFRGRNRASSFFNKGGAIYGNIPVVNQPRNSVRNFH